MATDGFQSGMKDSSHDTQWKELMKKHLKNKKQKNKKDLCMLDFEIHAIYGIYPLELYVKICLQITKINSLQALQTMHTDTAVAFSIFWFGISFKF